MPLRRSVTRVQWLAAITVVFALLGALSEGSRDVRAWSVIVQSALGLLAGGLAWIHRRLGGQLGV